MNWTIVIITLLLAYLVMGKWVEEYHNFMTAEQERYMAWKEGRE